MLFNVKYLTLASFFVVVAGQQPPQCVLACSVAAFGSSSNTSCTSITDPCICDDQGFQAADGACLQANCTTADQAVANQMQQALCGPTVSTTGSSSGTATSSATDTEDTSTTSASMTTSASKTTVTSSSSQSSASGSGSAATPSKSSGVGPQAEFGFFTLGVAAAGAVVGGLFI